MNKIDWTRFPNLPEEYRSALTKADYGLFGPKMPTIPESIAATTRDPKFWQTVPLEPYIHDRKGYEAALRAANENPPTQAEINLLAEMGYL